MTREIDFSEPLDEADEAYVRDRPWLIQDAELRGETVRFESEEEFTLDDSDDTGSDDSDDASTGDDAADESDTTETETNDEDGDESATGDDTGSESEDDADEAEEEGDDVPPYEEWDFQDLKTEAGNRGLKQNGSKESLIARLEEHDASQPE